MFKEVVDIVVYFDGSCKENTGGPMRCGYHVNLGDGRQVYHNSLAVDDSKYRHYEKTNNTAEFWGLLSALEWLIGFDLYSIDKLTVRGDSMLVIKAMNGEYKLRKPHLQKLLSWCQGTLKELDVGHIEFEHVPRERNELADEICG